MVSPASLPAFAAQGVAVGPSPPGAGEDAAVRVRRAPVRAAAARPATPAPEPPAAPLAILPRGSLLNRLA
jgi:hypothetical protein